MPDAEYCLLNEVGLPYASIQHSLFSIRHFPVPALSRHNPGLNLYALFLTVATFPLIFIGGLVTSHGAGMAVPDWPNSYGYNMFLFPPSKWVGNIWYEHVHRLSASFIGLLSIGLCLWAWLGDRRPRVRWLATAVL